MKNKLNRYFYLSILTLLSTISLPSMSLSNESRPKIQVVGEIWEPYQYPDASDNPKGFAVELVNKLLEKANFKPQKVEFYPWVRAYKKALKNKNTLILSLSRIPERENQFIWIGKINSEFFEFYALKSNTRIQAANSLEELYQYRIVVSKNSALDQYITKHNFPRVERTLNIDEGYQLLARDRVDLMFKAPSAIEPELEFMGYSENDLKTIFTPQDSKNDFYLALSQGSSPVISDSLQKAFQALVDSGTVDALKAKWGL